MKTIPKKPEKREERTPEETQRLAEKTLKTLLSTPPKPRTGKGGKDKERRDVKRG
jgi:hypothetical protein